MHTPLIIGLTGRARAGKDTVAQIIIDTYPEYKIQRLSAPLKAAVCELYNFTPEQVETNMKEQIDERWGKTPRETIQSLTDYMMTFMGTDFFTKKLYNMYDSKKIPEYMIIPDIRYNHDIVEIQKRGGIVIKVIRNNASVSHQFEQQIDNLTADYVIINDGTIESLHKSVMDIINQNVKNSLY